MRLKSHILSVSLLLIIYFALLIFIRIISAEHAKISNILANIAGNRIEIEKNLYSTIEKFDKSEVVKVEFWQLIPKNLEKGEYLGYASLKRGNLDINVKEEKLRNILSSPYVPVAELSAEGTTRDWKIVYQPGSITHLKSIAQEAWRWNYLSRTEISLLHRPQIE